MIRWVLCLVFWAGAAFGEADRFGLLWNATGLPATFPLQVRTDPGLDWRVTLLEAETGTPALAAAFEGGRFFRVLVPPGAYRLAFEAGPHWNGTDFGPSGATRRFTRGDPLVFEVQGLGRRRGHILDLRGDAQSADAPTRDISICQTLRLQIPEPGLPWLRFKIVQRSCPAPA